MNHPIKLNTIVQGEYGMPRAIMHACFRLDCSRYKYRGLDWSDPKQWNQNGNSPPSIVARSFSFLTSTFSAQVPLTLMMSLGWALACAFRISSARGRPWWAHGVTSALLQLLPKALAPPPPYWLTAPAS